MVDTYPMETIPRFTPGCIDPSTTEASAAGKLDGPYNVQFSVSVSSRPDIENIKQYHDSYSVPILINSYNAGDIITIVVEYEWNNGVALANIPSDYTLSVYSKQLLKVKDSLGATNQIYMNGRSPSGFT